MREETFKSCRPRPRPSVPPHPLEHPQQSSFEEEREREGGRNPLQAGVQHVLMAPAL